MSRSEEVKQVVSEEDLMVDKMWEEMENGRHELCSPYFQNWEELQWRI